MTVYAGSVVRYYPSLNTGEFINVGVICGNDEEGFLASWYPDRAGDKGAEVYLRGFVEILPEHLKLLDIMFLAGRPTITEHRIELTPPEIMLGESAQAVLDRMAKVRLP